MYFYQERQIGKIDLFNICISLPSSLEIEINLSRISIIWELQNQEKNRIIYCSAYQGHLLISIVTSKYAKHFIDIFHKILYLSDRERKRINV